MVSLFLCALCGKKRLTTMLPRILEPEVMDTAGDAQEYNAMDHSVVNAEFVGDLLRMVMDYSRPPLEKFLDLGAGTAQILIELACRAPNVQITAVDAAESMLALARENVARANLTDRIELVLADAKELPFENIVYDIVISNSILHHIPDPRTVVAEAIRVTASGGLLFHRDLARPNDEVTLQQLVATYAADSTPYQRKLFTESLYAALTVEEMRDLVTNFGFAADTVQMTSDRHWTWVATK